MRIVLTFLTIFFLLVGLLFWVANYEHTYFSYYEEAKANRYSNIIALTLFGGIFLLIFIRGLVSTIRKNEFELKEFTKETFGLIIFLLVFHFLLFQPVLSGAILIGNAKVGKQTTWEVSGTVVDVYTYSGKYSEYEITVVDRNNSATHEFDTNKAEASKYTITQPYQGRFNKGCLGLLYQYY